MSLSSQVIFCVTGTFEWDLEGRESNYANWAVGEPNGNPRSNFYQEDCVLKTFSSENVSEWMDFSCRKDALEQSGIHALCSQSNKGETEIFVALCLPKRVRGRFRVLIRLRSTYYDFATTDYRVSHFVQLTGCCLNGGLVQPSLIPLYFEVFLMFWTVRLSKAK